MGKIKTKERDEGGYVILIDFFDLMPKAWIDQAIIKYGRLNSISFNKLKTILKMVI